MFCPSCGANVPDGTQFCTACGARFQTKQNANDQSTTQQQNSPSPESRSPFVDSNEHLVATLKNGFVQNVISGEGFTKEDAYVTDKRVYYNARTGILNVKKVRNVIDIPEITGTKLMDITPWGAFILSMIGFIAGIIVSAAESFAIGMIVFTYALLVLIGFFIAKKKHFRIEYAGGFIYFSVRKYSMKNVEAFQKAIYAEKDKLKEHH